MTDPIQSCSNILNVTIRTSVPLAPVSPFLKPALEVRTGKCINRCPRVKKIASGGEFFIFFGEKSSYGGEFQPWKDWRTMVREGGRLPARTRAEGEAYDDLHPNNGLPESSLAINHTILVAVELNLYTPHLTGGWLSWRVLASF